jgi:hypothetical protein
LIRYYQGSIEDAKFLFARCLERNPSDCVAQSYLKRCA